MTVLTPEQMRGIDQCLPRDLGLDSLLLMENAAAAAAEQIRKKFRANARVLIFCGPGNNGGDGMALARLLLSHQFRVSLCTSGDSRDYTGDSLKQLKLCKKLNIPILNFGELPPDNSWDLLVDALLGTGMNRPPEGLLLSFINYINQSKAFCYSLDIPSGVKGNTGEVPGIAVRADETICFGRPKPGNLLYPGYKYQGKLYYSPISIPPHILHKDKYSISCLDHPALPETEKDIYKGSRGYGLVIGGSPIYRGAPVFTAAAFLKSGGGYVHLAAPHEVIQTTASRFPEFIQHDLGPGDRAWDPAQQHSLEALIQQKNWVVLGPGMGQCPAAGEMLRRLISHLKVPLILDGDGLNLMVNHLHILKDLLCIKILTPHPGEAARLLGCSTDSILHDPASKALELAAATRSLVILKLPHSLLADPEGTLSINLSGSSSLATAGSGDILSGIIPAMLGRGLQASEACKAAIRVHGLAGEILEARQGAGGSIASEILSVIPMAIETYSDLSRQERIQLV